MAFDFSFKKLQGGFFDDRKIAAAVAKADAKLQAKFGAYVRRRMQTSIKYRKGTAPAGQPPFAHRDGSFSREKTNKRTGVTTRQTVSPLRELIFFARDPDTGSVVIGPVAFGTRGAGALERGGRVTVRKKGKAVRTVTLAPHPFARPAGEAEAAKLPDLLRGMVN